MNDAHVRNGTASLGSSSEHGAPGRSRGQSSTLGTRAAEVIDAQREAIRDRCAAAVDGRDPEGVHRMRIACRRLRVAIGLFAPVLDDNQLAVRIAADARKLTRALGPVREADVLGLHLDDLVGRATPQRALAIEHLRARAARRQRRARRKMLRKLAEVDIDRFDARLRRLVDHLRHPTGGDSDGAHVAAAPIDSHPLLGPQLAMSRSRLVDQLDAVVHAALPAELGTAAARAALHALRIRAKKLRYGLEPFTPVMRREAPSAVAALKRLQLRLGEWHDATVLEALVEREAVRAERRGRPRMAHELVRLRRVLRRSVLRQERALRSDIERLCGERFREDVAKALAAGA